MKKFKEFLIEAEAAPTVFNSDSPSQETSNFPIPPGYPGTQQYGPPAPDEIIDRNPNPSSPIDWQEFDDEFTKSLEEYERILKILQGMNADEIIKYLQQMGLKGTTIDDIMLELLEMYQNKPGKVWHKKYNKNATPQQRQTYTQKMIQLYKMLERLYKQYRERMRN